MNSRRTKRPSPTWGSGSSGSPPTSPGRCAMIDHHLMADLRKLKLGGFGETLELRVVQAEKDELSPLAFLTFMVRDEIERREAKKLTVRIQKASFEEEKTLEEFD